MSERRTDTLLTTARIAIDLDALAGNWRRLAAMAPRVATGAALKADAYGLGAGRTSAALKAAGCRHFFVATAGEGVDLRAVVADAEIFVLAGLTREAAPYYFEADLTPVLNHPGEVRTWAQWCRQAGMRRPCALHVDTGMNRLGLTLAEAREMAGDPEHPVVPSLLMSHLATADTPDDPMNRRQLAVFRDAMALFPGTRASLANSAGIFLGSDYHFDVTRPGIALYGGEAVAGFPNAMAPVVTFEGRILQIRRVAAGEPVGYGAAAQTGRESRIAIVGAGYADGVMRGASGAGVAARSGGKGAKGWLAGRPVPIIGRISMDLTAFDVTDVPDALLQQAEWIEFFGPHVALDDFARSAGTIGYEVLTRLGERAARMYIEA